MIIRAQIWLGIQRLSWRVQLAQHLPIRTNIRANTNKRRYLQHPTTRKTLQDRAHPPCHTILLLGTLRPQHPFQQATRLSRPATLILPTTRPPTQECRRSNSVPTTHTDTRTVLPEAISHPLGRTPSPSTLHTARRIATTLCHRIRMDPLATRSMLPACRVPNTSHIQLPPCLLHPLRPPGPAVSTSTRTELPLHKQPTRPSRPMHLPFRCLLVPIILRQILMLYSQVATYAPIRHRRLPYIAPNLRRQGWQGTRQTRPFQADRRRRPRPGIQTCLTTCRQSKSHKTTSWRGYLPT